MKLIFLSNYYNHHQRCLCDELCRRCDPQGFTFVACASMREDRRALGYGESDIPTYVLEAHTPATRRQAIERMKQADVILLGAADREITAAALSRCKQDGTLTFRFSERLLKKGDEPLKYIPRRLRLQRDCLSPLPPPFSLMARAPRRSAPLYLLAAGAYAASDYHRFGLFRDRAYRWGYFPPLRTYADPDALMHAKDPHEILWVGRMIDWKHPEIMIALAGTLRETLCDGATNASVPFHITLIGTGSMESSLREAVTSAGISAFVTLAGSMKPDAVRDRMERAGILVSTSDRNEGWGAVINEAMNSACAVLASASVGSAPVLIRDGVNGVLFPCGDLNTLTQETAELLIHPDKQRTLGSSALQTVTRDWNASVAADRLLTLAESILSGEDSPDPFPDGICARE